MKNSSLKKTVHLHPPTHQSNHSSVCLASQHIMVPATLIDIHKNTYTGTTTHRHWHNHVHRRNHRHTLTHIRAHIHTQTDRHRNDRSLFVTPFHLKSSIRNVCSLPLSLSLLPTLPLSIQFLLFDIISGNCSSINSTKCSFLYTWN